MTADISECLEDIRIKLEVDTLTEDSAVWYLSDALRLCGVQPQSSTLEGLFQEAHVVLGDELLEYVPRRDASGRFIGGRGSRRARPSGRKPTVRRPVSKNKPASDAEKRARTGRKMAGTLTQRFGYWLGKSIGKAIGYVGGKAVQGAGSLLAKAKNKTLKKAGSTLAKGGKNYAKFAASL